MGKVLGYLWIRLMVLKVRSKGKRACHEIKDEQYGVSGAVQYYFPYLISTEHE